jgi:hypothetical protein
MSYPASPPPAPMPSQPPEPMMPVHPTSGPSVPPPPGTTSPLGQPGAGTTKLSDLLHDPTQLTEPVNVHRGPSTGRDAGVYPGHGRAQLAWGLAALAILFEIPVVVVLIRSLVGPVLSVSGVVAGLFLVPGVPLFAAGLYGLFAGRVMIRPGEGLAAVARRPLALLVVGGLLLIAAGLAAG